MACCRGFRILAVIALCLIWSASGQWISDTWTLGFGNNIYNTPTKYNLGEPGSRGGAYTAVTKDAQNSSVLRMFGGWGNGVSGAQGLFSDMWRWKPDQKIWEWKNVASTTWYNLASRYGPVDGELSDSAWPGGRCDGATWTDRDGNMWIFGGYGVASDASHQGVLSDVWKWSESSQQWSFMSGSRSIYEPRNTASSASLTPGCRLNPAYTQDSAGNFYLIGGLGTETVGNAIVSRLFNDVWSYSTSNRAWNLLSLGNQITWWGTKGSESELNVPPVLQRSSAAYADGYIYLFGGQSRNQTSDSNSYNSLWRFNLATRQWAWISGSSEANQPGVYTLPPTSTSPTLPPSAPGSAPEIEPETAEAPTAPIAPEAEPAPPTFEPVDSPSPIESPVESPEESPVEPMEPPVAPVEPPVAPAEPPLAPVESPVVPVESPVAPVESPVAPVEPPLAPVESPVAPVESPVAPVEPPLAPVESPVAPVEPPLAPVEPPVTPLIPASTRLQTTSFSVRQLQNDLTTGPGSRFGHVLRFVSENTLILQGGIGLDLASFNGTLNDLWSYNIAENEWNWLSGSPFLPLPTAYNGRGETGMPGGRWMSGFWIDDWSNLWFPNGYEGDSHHRNDVWSYSLSSPPPLTPSTYLPMVLLPPSPPSPTPPPQVIFSPVDASLCSSPVPIIGSYCVGANGWVYAGDFIAPGGDWLLAQNSTLTVYGDLTIGSQTNLIIEYGTTIKVLGKLDIFGSLTMQVSLFTDESS